MDQWIKLFFLFQVFDSDFGQEVLFDDETRLAHLSIITAIKLFDTNYKDMIFACFHVLISLIRSLKQPSITREEKTLRRLKFHFRNEKRTNLKRFYVMFRPQAMVVRCDIREDSSLYLLMYPKWFIHQFYYGQGDGELLSYILMIIIRKVSRSVLFSCLSVCRMELFSASYFQCILIHHPCIISLFSILKQLT